jgi:hypothetical protein
MGSRQAVGLIILGFGALVSQGQCQAATQKVLDAEKAELAHSLDQTRSFPE